MARLAGVTSLLWLLVAGASAQGSQRPPPGRNPGGDGPQRMMPVEQRGEPAAQRDAAPPVGGNRMSPEERRQLRRDVHEAGRDLYSERMPPARRESRRQ